MKRSIFLMLCMLVTQFEFASEHDKKAFLNTCTSRNDQLVRKLLQQDPRLVHARDDIESTPLHRAVSSRRNLIVVHLLECKADIDAKDKYGETPLHNASGEGLGSAVSTLLQHKADIHAKNQNGDTPLFCAIYWEKSDVTELLLLNNADPNTKNKTGLTPFQQYLERKRSLNEWDVQMFLAAGAIYDNQRDHHDAYHINVQGLLQQVDFSLECIRCNQDAIVENVQKLIFPIALIDIHTQLPESIQSIMREYAAIYNDKNIVRLLQRRKYDNNMPQYVPIRK